MEQGKCITCGNEIIGCGYCSKECADKSYTEEELEVFDNIIY